MKTRLMHSTLITYAGGEAINCVERQKGKKSKQRVICGLVCDTRLHCHGNLLGLLFGNDLQSMVGRFHAVCT